MDKQSEQRSTNKMRRRPQQERSRERIETILAITSRLLAEKGLDGTTMKGISIEAKSTIAALYQYFDSKSAIIFELARRHHRSGRVEMSNHLRNVHTANDILAAAFGILDTCMAQRFKSPEIQPLLYAANATPVVASYAHAELVYLASNFSKNTAKFINEQRRESYADDVLFLFIASHAVVSMLPQMADEERKQQVATMKRRIQDVYKSYSDEPLEIIGGDSQGSQNVQDASPSDNHTCRPTAVEISLRQENERLRHLVVKLSLENADFRELSAVPSQ